MPGAPADEKLGIAEISTLLVPDWASLLRISPLAATREEGDDAFVAQTIRVQKFFARRSCGMCCIDFFNRRIAYIIRLVVVFGVEVRFKGQDAEDAAHELAYRLYAPLFPGPDLGRDVVVDGDAEIFWRMPQP